MNTPAPPRPDSSASRRSDLLQDAGPQVLEAGEQARGHELHAAHVYHLSRRAGLLATGVLLFGFVGGYGVGVGVRKRDIAGVSVAKTAQPATLAPIVKAMHLSPDGKLLAFTAVYDQSRRSSRLVLDVGSKRFSGAESPEGWQDFVLGWARDSHSLLLRRERIPRPVAEASAGFYKQKLLAGAWPRLEASVSEVKPKLPRGEKSAFGFWDESGRLIVRTARAPKSLFAGGKKLDSSPDLYLQNRIVREAAQPGQPSREVLYVVRNSTPDVSSPPALFRVENGQARRLSEGLPDLEWAYVAENGRWMIASRYAANGTDWQWTLYQVTPAGATKVREATIPADVIATYWSPDFKSVLGASGESLWQVDIPTLKCRKIGDEKSANADDAAWSLDSKAVFVAVDGKILKLDLQRNQTQEVWRFPDQYWN